MALTSSRTLGIEIAGTRVIALEADPATDPPTILQAVTGEAPTGGLAGTLKTLLAEHRIGARSTHLVLSDPGAIHRLLQLPPMTSDERQLFLERELGREMGGRPLLGQTVVRAIEGPPRKEEALVAAVPRAEGDQILTALVAAGLAPRLVTTGALAVARAAEVLAPASFERPAAVAHWGSRGLTVVVVDEGTLRFTREVPHLTVPGVDVGEWFVTEFQRSIRQYQQAVKGRAVGSVLIGSVDARFEAALPTLEPRLGLPVVNLNDALGMSLPEDTPAGPETPAGVFLLPLGAAALSARESPNLIPPAIEAQRRLGVLKRAAVAAAALLVLTLGYSTWSAWQEAATYRKQVARLTAERQARQAEVAQRDQIKQDRDRQYQRIRLLTADPLGDPPLAAVFKEISRVAPEELRLDRLTLARDANGMAIRLVGRVESADLAQAQAEFNRFYVGLQASPLFSEVIFNPPSQSKVSIQQGPSPSVEGRTARDFQRRNESGESREGVSGQGRKLAFELELRLRGVK